MIKHSSDKIRQKYADNEDVNITGEWKSCKGILRRDEAYPYRRAIWVALYTNSKLTV